MRWQCTAAAGPTGTGANVSADSADSVPVPAMEGTGNKREAAEHSPPDAPPPRRRALDPVANAPVAAAQAAPASKFVPDKGFAPHVHAVRSWSRLPDAASCHTPSGCYQTLKHYIIRDTKEFPYKTLNTRFAHRKS